MSLYKISAFSRLGQVSIKALRLYDQRGLLKPAQIDRETGYRYYQLEQLTRLHRLLALKAMGFSLEQIGQLLKDDLSLSQMQAMLRLRQAELQQQLRQTSASLAAVDTHLNYIQAEKTMPEYQIILKSVEPICHVISIRDTIDAYLTVGELFGEIMTHVPPSQTAEEHYCAAIWHNLEYREKDVDAEAILAVPEAITGNQRLQIKDLPAIELAAAVIHHGPYSALNQSYGAITQWIEDNHYQICGPNREVYLQGINEQDNPDNSVTELQFPVAKIAV